MTADKTAEFAAVVRKRLAAFVTAPGHSSNVQWLGWEHGQRRDPPSSERSRQPCRHMLTCWPPDRARMCQVGTERMGKSNLPVRHLAKVSIAECGCGEECEQPCFDASTNSLDRIERQRRTAINVSVKQTNPRIETDHIQSNEHLGSRDPTR